MSSDDSRESPHGNQGNQWGREHEVTGPPTDQNPQRAIGEPRFDPLAVGHTPALDDGVLQGLLQMIPAPLLSGDPLQGVNACVQDVARRGFELGPGPVIDDEIAVGYEEETEHVAALPQQLNPGLDEGRRCSQDLLLAR